MAMNEKELFERLERLAVVMQRTGLTRPTIYRQMKLGQFPQNIKLSARSVAWLSTEIDGWIHGRIQASRKAA